MSGCLGPCDLPNVLTISSEGGTVWLGGITEFNQYQASAARSKDAGELLHLPKEFRTFYPFRRSDSGPAVFLYPITRVTRLNCRTLTCSFPVMAQSNQK
jgi:hypothetical protein